MTHRIAAASILAGALLLWVAPPSAQNTRGARSSPEPTAPRSTDASPAADAPADQCERLKDLAQQMAEYQQQVSVTTAKLKQNIADLQSDPSSERLRPKLAEQSGLLDVLQLYLTQQSNLTQSMNDELRDQCPAPAPKKPASN